MQMSWDLTRLYDGDNDPKIEIDKKKIGKAVGDFSKKWRKNTEYLVAPKVLRQALDQYEQLSWHFGVSGRPGFYFWLRSELDALDSELKAKTNQLMEFAEKNANSLRFFTLSLSQVSIDQQQKFLNAPELNTYRHFLERLFATAAYRLSEKEENILSLFDQPASYNWIRMTEEFLSAEERTLTMNGREQKKSFSELISLTTDQDKATRDQAATYVNEIVGIHASVAEHELNSILLTHKQGDQLRGFTRPDQSRHLADDVDTQVVDAMLSAVEQQFSLAHQFYRLKAKILKLSQLKYHERGVEVGSLPDDFSAEKSVGLVKKVLGRLDQEFQMIFETMLAAGQLDFLPRRGKSGGAFCAADLPSLPTFVLLNHTDKLRDVTTLAHEMGHAINDELMKKHRHALDCGSTLFVAEVASTFIEDFVLEELATAAKDEQRLAIIMMKLNDDISTIFRQVAAYRFEQELHRQFRAEGYLSKEKIGELFQRHMAAYMGPVVEQSTGSENWWVYWSHFRRFFYVYSYASGLLISKALQAKVRQNPTSIKNVKEFLSTGLSKSPVEMFDQLGLDVTNEDFWLSGLQEVKQLLAEAEILAKKLRY